MIILWIWLGVCGVYALVRAWRELLKGIKTDWRFKVFFSNGSTLKIIGAIACLLIYSIMVVIMTVIAPVFLYDDIKQRKRKEIKCKTNL